MSGKPSFIGMLTYGVRTLFWRPVQSLVYIAVVSVGYAAYYMWAASEGGSDFFSRYAMAMTPAGMSDLGGFFEQIGVLMLMSFILGTIMYGAAFRVMVRENVRPWGVFQLGRDELNMFGLILLIGLIMIGITIIASIVMGILIFILSLLLIPVMAGGGDAASSMQAATMFGMLSGLLIFIPIAYFAGRFGVSLPLSIKRKRFTMDGWKVSKGAGVSMLLAHLVIYLLMMAVQFVLAPDLMQMSFGMSANQAGVIDVDEFTRLMSNPYGGMVYIAVPIQALMSLLMLGPVSAVAAKAE